LVVLTEYLTGAALGLDTWWFGGAVQQLQSSYPGRPSPQTTITVIALSVTVISLRVEGLVARVSWVIGLGIGLLIPVLAIGGYLFNATQIFAVAVSTGMALVTAVCLLAIAVMCLVLRPDRPPLSWLTRLSDPVPVVRMLVVLAGLPLLTWIGSSAAVALGADQAAGWVIGLAVATVGVAVTVYAISAAQQRASSQRLLLAEELAQVNERYRLMVERGSDILVTATPDGTIEWVSPSVTAVLGWEPQAFEGLSSDQIVHPEDRATLEAAVREVFEGGQSACEVRLRTVDDDYRWVSGPLAPRVDSGGQVTGRIAVWRDTHDEHLAKAALAESESRFRLLMENATDIVLRVRDGRVTWSSAAITPALGGTPGEWSGTDLATVMHPDDLAAYQACLGSAEAGEDVRRRLRIRARDGRYHWIEAHAKAFLLDDGRSDGIVCTAHVIDAAVAAEQELERLARFDALTGVINRAEMLGRLQMAVGQRRHPGRECGVLFCDVDRFKQVNDELGHAAGDEVLRALAHRMTASVRREDVVARMGGDEFLVFLAGIHDVDEAVTVAEKIRVAAAEPIEIDEGRAAVVATLSIGVSMPVPGESIDAFIARADRAMYLAKQGGRNTVTVIRQDSG
jgi:diguanylate cyclase (GGDEF)-like protein/PAS domain S-box-containing protein